MIQIRKFWDSFLFVQMVITYCINPINTIALRMASLFINLLTDTQMDGKTDRQTIYIKSSSKPSYTHQFSFHNSGNISKWKTNFCKKNQNS